MYGSYIILICVYMTCSKSMQIALSITIISKLTQVVRSSLEEVSIAAVYLPAYLSTAYFCVVFLITEDRGCDPFH